MMLGMAAFMVGRLTLTAQGYAPLLDPTSIEFQAGMGIFMGAPMVAWMRVRGCNWRECSEMSAAMMLSTAAVLVLRAFDLRDAQVWLASNQHTLMLGGMFLLMVCRREHYTRGYSFARLPSSSRQQQRANA